MKNAFFITVLAILSLIGASALFAIVYPQEARTYLTDGLRAMLRPVVAKDKGPERVNRPEVAIKPEAPSKGGPVTVTPTGNPGTGFLGLSMRQPPPRSGGAPPPRSTAAPTAGQPLRKAAWLGPSPENVSGTPPNEALYPFSVVRRVFPTPDTIRLELNIRNASGSFWEVATLYFKSERHAQAVAYRIERWRPEETISLEYTFPKTELEDRLKNLRLVRISGLRSSAVLTEMLSDRRIGETGGSASTGKTSAGSASSVTAPGLMGLVGAMTSPFTGVEVNIGGGATAVPDTPVSIVYPGEHSVADKNPLSITGGTADGDRAAELAGKVHYSALTVQMKLSEFVATVQNKPFATAMSDGGKDLQDAVIAAQKDFNKASMDLGLLIGRSKEPAVKGLEKPLTQLGQSVYNMVAGVQAQVQYVAPSFVLVAD